MKEWLSKNILFLFLFPFVYFLFNSNEHYYSTTWDEGIVVIAVSFLVEGLIVIGFNVIYRNIVKASIATFAVVLLIGFVSYILFYLKQHVAIIPVFRGRFILPSLFLCVLGFLFFIYKRKSTLHTLVLYLNLTMILNLGLEIGKAITIPKKQRKISPKSIIANPKKTYPDVYFILSDAYTSIEMLKKYHSGDNSKFVAFLDSTGFKIVPNARSSYKFTYRTLGSIWNMDYLPDSLDDTPENSSKNACLEQLLIENKSTQWFQKRGYECINSTSYPFYNQPASPLFETSFTFLSEVYVKTLFHVGFGGFIDLWYTMPKERDRHQRIIQETIALAKKPSNYPKLVYCHLYMPHDPYVFLPSGEINTWSNPYDHDPKKYYDQVLYTNSLLTQLIKGLMDLPGDPIVILTGDHGYRQFIHEPEKTESAYSALTAFYFPSKDYSQIHEGLTSPNIMRLVFNQLEPGSFPLLKDTSNFYYK